MECQLFQPTKGNGLIRLIWEQKSDIASSWKILPSGKVELIFRLGKPFRMDHERSHLKRSSPTSAFCFFSGLHTRPLYFEYDSFHFIGVQLEPVAIKALSGIPASDLKDNAAEGIDLFSGMAELEDVLCTPVPFAQKAVFLEEWITRRIRESQALNLAVKLASTIDLLTQCKRLGHQVDLERHLGYSRAQTFRIFNDWFGDSSNKILRLGQFVHTLNNLHFGPEKLTDIALQNGYFDQSHFIRGFKEFAEMTPLEYRLARTNLPGQLSY